MRKLFAVLLLLCSWNAWAGVAFNAFAAGNYGGAGTNSINVTASGTNLGCVLYVWYRSGAITSPMCGGNAMTLVGSQAMTGAGAVNVSEYIYFGSGLVAGTVTASISASVESSVNVIIVNGASQTGQPDATAAYVSGTTNGSGQFGLPITINRPGSLVIGIFSSSFNAGDTPSTTGTYIGRDNIGWGLWFWYSTTNPGSGSFTLDSRSGSAGLGIDAFGLSIAPAASAITVIPRHSAGFIQ